MACLSEHPIGKTAPGGKGNNDMPRNMSFALTINQVLDKSKTVTRRQGWWNLKPGDQFWAVEKAMGLKKGEKVKKLALCEVVSTRRERLSDMYTADCTLEGFPGWSRAKFMIFYAQHNKIRMSDFVNRIQFKYL